MNENQGGGGGRIMLLLVVMLVLGCGGCSLLSIFGSVVGVMVG